MVLFVNHYNFKQGISFYVMNYNNNICRACLATEIQFNHYLFQDVTVEDFVRCSSIKVLEDDHFTKAICDLCYDLLIKFVTFKAMCLKSDRTLKLLHDKQDNLMGDVHDDTKSDRAVDCHYFLGSKSEGSDCEAHSTCEKKTKPKRIKKEFNLSCNLCTKKFIHKSRFKAHKLWHQGLTEIVNCNICHKTFSSQGVLNRHKENVHTLVKLDSLRCHICFKISKNKQTLKMHIKLHKGNDTVVCDVCGRTFANKLTFKNHIKTHEENRIRKHPCNICGLKFFNNTALSSHRFRHERRYICDCCNQQFSEKHNLIKHILSKQGITYYECKICRKQFKSQSYLIEHKRMHSGITPYSCSVCKKGFISRRRMVEHERVHTGEKPFQCVCCQQSFTQKGSLNRHMKMHKKKNERA